MSGVTPQTYLPFLKEYTESPLVLRDLIYRNFKLLGLLERDTSAGGKVINVPINISGSQGISNIFSDAYNNITPGIQAEFQMPLTDYFAVAKIDNKAWQISQDQDQAFENALSVATRSAMRELAKQVAWSLYRSGTGTIGFATDMTSNGIGVITLGAPTTSNTPSGAVAQTGYGASDAMVFAQGMTLQAFNGDGSGTGLAAVGYVVKVNAQAGQITVSATPGGSPGLPSGWASGTSGYPFLVPQGNFNNNVVGLGQILPMTSTPGTMWGQDRSIDVQKLAGTYVPLSNSSSMEDVLINGVNQQALFGGNPDVVLMHQSSYSALQKSLQGKNIPIRVEGAHEGVGYNGVQIDAGGCSPVVLADPFCPPGIAYSLQLDTFKLMSAGQFPGPLKSPTGMEFVDIFDENAIVYRLGGYATLRCDAPGLNAVIVLPE